MDIVDINKVLDDLEFNEEQRAKLTKSGEPNARPSPPQPHQTNQNFYTNDHGARATAAPQIPTPTQPPIPSRVFKKNFVNVSNVFSSLNEYVNAEIDTSKGGGEHIAQPPSYVAPASGGGRGDEHSSSSPLVSTAPAANYMATGIGTISTATANTVAATAPFTIDAANSTRQDRELVVQNQSNSVPNHSVNRNNACDLEIDQYGVSEQAAADASEIQRHESDSDTSDTEEDEDDEDDGDDDDDDDEDDDEVEQQDKREEEAENESAQARQNNVNCNESGATELLAAAVENHDQRKSDHDHHPQANGLNAVEGADIRQPGANNWQSELPAVNEAASLRQHNIAETVALDGASQIEHTNDARHNDSECNAAPPAASECRAAHTADVRPTSDAKCAESGCVQQVRDDSAPSKSTELIRPISFEQAATMDDVSDAELESYLETLEQDMDEAKQCNESKVAGDTQRSHAAMDPIIHETLKDDRNADSFSQASTIEFGDGNLDSEMPLSASQFSLTNLATEPEPEPSVSGGQNDDCTATITDDQRTATDTVTDRHFTEPNDDPANMGGDTSNGVRRPTSLNLYKVYEVGQPPVSNAGSTPMLLTTATMPSVSSDGTVETASPFTSDATAETSSPLETSSPMNHADGSNNAAGLWEASDPALNGPDASGGQQAQPSESALAAPTHLSNSANISLDNIGKVQPYWIPDNMSLFCMICNLKFTFIKRRHHCRACGLVLCKTCCSLKAKLEYMGDAEARICIQCDLLLNKHNDDEAGRTHNRPDTDEAASDVDVASGIDSAPNADGNVSAPITRSPNPNNPMEYCSVIPPHQQVASSSSAPISVMVPVGILKRSGSKTQRKEKNVMFSDGLRPNVDLDMDSTWESRSTNENGESAGDRKVALRPRNADKLPMIDPKTNSYIPPSRPSTSVEGSDTSLPPICLSTRNEFKYADVENGAQLMKRLENEQLKFMISRNFYVLARIVKLTCCINRAVINFTTQGMHLVGQDEIVILLELDASNQLPKDIFVHLNEIYHDADKGQAITELGFSMASATPFLGSKEHGGFLFIRTTFQCTQNITIPENPYLIGILIHRWEVPWAKVFPLRLMLRLGALHRYYPSPHVSVRQRDSVYAEIAQTIINFLADFRTYSYTLPTIRGMYIHMEDRRTIVLIPRNRYDQIMKALGNSSDHIIALAANFSKTADGHLVCVQNTESGCAETHAYSTQAINIQGKPRKVTGASFLVLNGALKSTSGLSGKCSIVEDGLMVQILPKKMTAIQQALKTMKDIDIVCGPVDGDETQTEVVAIQWIENDKDFNVGVISLIDNKPMDGIPSIRVHQGLDFTNSYHVIRWTEVFILKSDEESARGKDPIDISKLSESIARSTSMALVPFVDLLASTGQTKFAIRATLDQDQVCYEAASRTEKLGPLYMNALDNELISLLHRQATNLQLDQTICLELIFYILDA